MQQIQLNSFLFLSTLTKLEVGFFKEKTEGHTSLYKGEYLIELLEQYESELKKISHSYYNFSTTENVNYIVTADMKMNSNFCLRYFYFLVYNNLQGQVDVLFQNFVNDVEVSKYDKTKSTTQFNLCNKFILKFQYETVSNTVELVASYDCSAESIYYGVTTYVKQKQDVKRLIIHFYKKMSEQELEQIFDVLYHLELGIPVIVVSINKTESNELFPFDIKVSKILMLLSYTILQIGKRVYLLCNNTRYTTSSPVRNKEYHFPIKLHISSTHPEVFDDIAVVKDLMDQVYQFSRMYWKSISQQSLPVTTLYPEMVAEMYPHFENEHLSDFGKNNLWFL